MESDKLDVPWLKREPPPPGESRPLVAAPSPARAPGRKSGRLWIIPGVVVLLAFGAGGAYWYRLRVHAPPAAEVAPPPVAPAPAPPQLVSGLTPAPAAPAPPKPPASEPPQMEDGLRQPVVEAPADTPAPVCAVAPPPAPAPRTPSPPPPPRPHKAAPKRVAAPPPSDSPGQTSGIRSWSWLAARAPIWRFAAPANLLKSATMVAARDGWPSG